MTYEQEERLRIAIRDVTDNRLVDEIARRNIKSFRDTLTDEQIRAECDRRGIGALDPRACTDTEIRNEAARRFGPELEKELVEAILQKEAMRNQLSLAEADLKEAREDLKYVKQNPWMFAPKSYVPMRPDNGATRLRNVLEPGPGIEAMPQPDTGHWVDPLDLLADDE